MGRSWVPYLLFLVWPVALCPKEVQLVIYLLILACLAARAGSAGLQRITVGPVEGFLVCFCAVYLLAILVHAPQSSTSRILAAINTLACWGISICLFTTIRYSDVSSNVISKIAFANVAVLIGLALAYYAGLNITMPVDARTLSGADWINGERSTRLHAFLEYSTLVAAMYFLFFPLSLEFAKGWRHRLFSYAYCVVAAIPVLACGSRTGILLAIIAVMGGIFYVNASSGERVFSKGTKILLVGIVMVLLCVLFHEEIISSITSLLDSRQGSTDTRRSLYEYTFHEVMTTSPIIGCGIKDTIAQFGEAVPVGSHSTYLGVLYRTGIIGALFFLAALVYLIKAMATSTAMPAQRSYCVLYILLFLAFFVMEDIDGADWLVMSTFAIAGLLCRSSDIHPARTQKTRIVGRQGRRQNYMEGR